MRALALPVVIALATALPAAAKNASVTIKNKSHWEIHQLYLSAADEDQWGPDQLGQRTIAARGGSYTLTDIPCDKYDVRVIDEDGDECVVARVPLCSDHEWVIKDDDLLSCQAESDNDDDD